jgi:hypothetical protein
MLNSPLLKPIILSVARHLATAAGTALAGYGVIQSGQAEAVAGALMVLVSVGLGAVDKVAQAKK